jgi:TolB protein
MSRFILIILLFISTLFGYDATIEIVKRMDTLPKIAVENSSYSFFDQNINKKFFKLLVGDLKVTSHFIVYEDIAKKEYDSSFLDNTLIDKNVELAIRCKLETDDQKNIIASVKLVNIKNARLLYEKFYKISQKERFPFLAHKITMDINSFIGAEPIEWMQKFVIFAKYTDKRESEIVISDYTLTYQKTIIKGGLNVFPKWANSDQNSFYYTTYNTPIPTLYKFDLFSGNKTKIVSSEGMLVCSDVSKDGSKLLLTMAPNDQPDIYLYDLRSKRKQKLTSYRGIDVNGNFVDDDTRIIFVSDRLGYPNIFAKEIGSRGVEQMVYFGKNNNSCTALGKYIAYSSRESDSEFGPKTFNLYLISTETDYVRQLTATGKNLYPRFADSGTILFIKHYKNQSALGVIRLISNKSYQFPLRVGKIQSIDW